MSEEVRSVIDLADHIGFEAIDAEIATWIEIGEFDEEVRERAKEINTDPNPYVVMAIDYIQRIHRLMHPSGPWGFEFCSKCLERNGP